MVDLGRHRPATVPDRGGLPGLERYARLAVGGEERPAGYVEASRGCVHRCRHCPVPVVYDGRLRIVPEGVVLADVEALVEAGARHLTFGDPDFLNGPHHSLRVVAAVHKHWPELTFDCTTKVEHILRHEGLWPELAEAGCLFVVSAFESVNDDILAVLDKGHTTAEAAAAVALLRRHGIEIRPSFLPFTPWTTLDDVADVVDFAAALDLVPNVDPVQNTIRLLVPHLRADPGGGLRRRRPLRAAGGRPRRRRGPTPPHRTLVLLRRAHRRPVHAARRRQGTGAPQIGNQRVRSPSRGTSPLRAPWSSSSRWLSRFSPPPGAGTNG